jgi:hypothetical protein
MLHVARVFSFSYMGSYSKLQSLELPGTLSLSVYVGPVSITNPSPAPFVTTTTLSSGARPLEASLQPTSIGSVRPIP